MIQYAYRLFRLVNMTNYELSLNGIQLIDNWTSVVTKFYNALFLPDIAYHTVLTYLRPPSFKLPQCLRL